MRFSIKYLFVFIAFMLLAFGGTQIARAELPPENGLADEPATGLSESERLSLGREFLTRIRASLKKAEKTSSATLTNAEKAKRFPDGEELLLRVRLEKRLLLDAPLLARVEKEQFLVSLRDFLIALDFPIDLDESGIAEGWYIRENKKFYLNSSERKVVSDAGEFNFSEFVAYEDGDVMVPVDELGQWFGFGLDINVTALDLKVDSPLPLPIQEQKERRAFKAREKRRGPPVLPLREDEDIKIAYPVADVSTRLNYDRPGETKKGEVQASTSIRTAAEVMGGTLTSQTLFDKEDYLTNARASYKKESLERELLGPLKARRYEIGDVSAAPLQLRANSALGLGVRVTDRDPLRNINQSTTEITGTIFPGWDVELYRDDLLLAVQTVGDDGLYRFEDIALFTSENNFRVVLYGPQGEVREEEISIPVDTNRLAEDSSAYDITITAQDTQTYRKRKLDDEDEGAPNITAIYESPLGDKSAYTLGFETGQRNGTQTAVAHTGISTVMSGTLLNLDTAVDQAGEAAAQLVARRDLGEHRIRNDLKLSSKNYGTDESDSDGADFLTERITLNGPFPVPLGRNPQYNLSLGYALEADNDKRIETTAGLSSSWKGLSFSQQLTGAKTDGLAEEQLNSLSTVSGSLGRNRLRFTADYQIKPESQLQTLNANVRRSLKKDMELELGLRREVEERLTEGRAQMNWKAGFADISPSVSYNSQNDLAAGVNTRFSLVRDPQSKNIRFFDRNISTNGIASVFVFLDKNGNNVFDDGDEPIPNAVVNAPQNGGRETTDDKGYAFMNRLISLKPTDIFLEPSSLEDPYWIPGYEGASIVPREGHIETFSFPVHVSGEIDGTVFLKSSAGHTESLRGIRLSLVDDNGKKIASAISENDGFYVMSKIPPGRYTMLVDSDSFENEMARPLPQTVTIGYDGTTIYGKNIYFEEGLPDVPVKILSSHDVAEENDARLQSAKYILNLGTYKSQLTLGLAWFKIRNFYHSIVGDLELETAPSRAVPDNKTNEYALRLFSKDQAFEAAHERCRIFVQSGQLCSVEIISWEKEKTASLKN